MVARRGLRFPIPEEIDTSGLARLSLVRLFRAAALAAQVVSPAHHADPRMRRNSPQRWVRAGTTVYLARLG
jgi:hypothetical protein